MSGDREGGGICIHWNLKGNSSVKRYSLDWTPSWWNVTLPCDYTIHSCGCEPVQPARGTPWLKLWRENACSTSPVKEWWSVLPARLTRPFFFLFLNKDFQTKEMNHLRTTTQSKPVHPLSWNSVVTESNRVTDCVPSASLCYCLNKTILQQKPECLLLLQRFTATAVIIRCDLKHQFLSAGCYRMNKDWATQEQEFSSYERKQLLFSVWLNNAWSFFGPI